MSEPTTRYGRHLWGLLPQHVRTRDAEHDFDLLGVLDAIGHLLDDVRGTLDQRLAEVTPGAHHPVLRLDPDDDQRVAQEWLLPYYAALLDARLVSPHADGRRTELQNAVAWRQGKGTPRVAEAAAEEVAQREVELVEGRNIVATTPRVGEARLPEAALTDRPHLGDTDELADQPLLAAQHPALRAVTPDVGRPGRVVRPDPDNPGSYVVDPRPGHVGHAVTTSPGHPQARRRELPGGGDDVVWRHAAPDVAPCFPATHEDTSRRTPDVRRPTARVGWHHPKRVVAFTAPPTGFFPPPPRTHALADVPVDEARLIAIADTEIDSLTVSDGQVLLTDVTINGPITITAPGTHRFERVVQTSAGGPATITTAGDATIELVECAFGDIDLTGTGSARGDRGSLDDWPLRPEPITGADVLVAVDSLIGSVRATGGRVTLDRSTVLGDSAVRVLRTSDTILAGAVVIGGRAAASCLRYSRVPVGLPASVRRYGTTTRVPLFMPALDCGAWSSVDAAVYGEPGCGVLHLLSPEAILGGAEDGGELGTYHHRFHVLGDRAITAKLADFVPVGIDAVAVPDVRLLVRPPEEPQ